MPFLPFLGSRRDWHRGIRKGKQIIFIVYMFHMTTYFIWIFSVCYFVKCLNSEIKMSKGARGACSRPRKVGGGDNQQEEQGFSIIL